MGRLHNLITQIKRLFFPDILVKFIRVPRRIEDVKHYRIRDGFKGESF